jgi:hypothetical protein
MPDVFDEVVEPVGTLTRDDLWYMKHALRVDFAHGLITVNWYFWPYKDVPGHVEQYKIPASSVICSEAPSWVTAFTHTDCRASVNGEDSAWMTIARSLKMGDRIGLSWYPDALTTQDMREKGLHADAVYLRVYSTFRGKATKKAYLVATGFSNEDAGRMMRPPTSETNMEGKLG